jgi:hypothetical protein
MNERLVELKEMAKRQDRLELQIRTQEGRVSTHARVIARLRREMESKAAVVEHWRGRGIHVFFARLVGRLDRRIAQAVNEHRAASDKHDRSIEELSLIEQRLQELREQLSNIGDPRAEREQLLCEKELALAADRDPRFDELRDFSARLADAHSRVRATGLAMRSLAETSAALAQVAGDLQEFFTMRNARAVSSYAPSPAPLMASAQSNSAYARKMTDQLERDLAPIEIRCHFSTWHAARARLLSIRENFWGSWSDEDIEEARQALEITCSTIVMVERCAEDRRWRIREIEREAADLTAERQTRIETLE